MKVFTLLSFFILLLISGASAQTPAPVRLRFEHALDGNPVLIDSLRYQNAAEESFSVSRLSYMLSTFRFVDGVGNERGFPDVYGFIDLTGHRTSVVLEGLPEGKYTALKFQLGMDQKVNHGDPASYGPTHPLNPAVNRMHWDWQNGYIFAAIEGHWRGKDGQAQGYAYHYARVENQLEITLPLDLEHKVASDVAIDFDIKKMLDGLSFERDGATTHSQAGDPVSDQIKKNLPGAFAMIGAKSVVAGTILQPTVKLKPIDMPEKPTPYRFTIPKHVPIPPLPMDNPLIVERVDLGKALFETPLFSVDETFSCASCHMSGYGFAEQRPISPGVKGRGGKRNSMTLVNLAWKDSFFWDGRAKTLREQVLIPIESEVELGNKLDEVVARLKKSEEFPPKFKAAFGSGEISPLTISLALENFLLTLVSFDSKFDKMIRGEAKFDSLEKKGMELFFTESEPRMGKRGADCFHCHGSVFFTDHGFHNNGQRDPRDIGLMEVTKQESDRGKFGTPTLRNIEVTFPYMHHGRTRSLEDVIDHYDSGFEMSPTLDPNLAKHKNGLGLSKVEKKALVAFLKTLTDKTYWEDWPEGRE
jgi:cytochrome c peroxidase